MGCPSAQDNSFCSKRWISRLELRTIKSILQQKRDFVVVLSSGQLNPFCSRSRRDFGRITLSTVHYSAAKRDVHRLNKLKTVHHSAAKRDVHRLNKLKTVHHSASKRDIHRLN